MCTANLAAVHRKDGSAMSNLEFLILAYTPRLNEPFLGVDKEEKEEGEKEKEKEKGSDRSNRKGKGKEGKSKEE